MKKLFAPLLILAFLFSNLDISSQECEIYSDYKVGTSTKMVHYEKKDKPTGFTVTTVKDKADIPDGIEVLFHQKYDNYEDYNFESEFTIKCEAGKVIVDMAKFLDPNSMTAYENMEFEILADDLSIPSGAKPGDVLDDGSLTVTVNTGSPIKITIIVTLSNRRVESKESLETPAGKFECLKISYDMLTQIGFVKLKSSASEFYNKKHGVIRSESYNKKGKLTGYSVIEEISN